MLETVGAPLGRPGILDPLRRTAEVPRVDLLKSNARLLAQHRLDELVQKDGRLAAPVAHLRDREIHDRIVALLVVVPHRVVALLTVGDRVHVQHRKTVAHYSPEAAKSFSRRA